MLNRSDLTPYPYVVENDIGLLELMADTESLMFKESFDTALVAIIMQLEGKYYSVYTKMSLPGLMRKGFLYYLELTLNDRRDGVAYSCTIVTPIDFITCGFIKEPRHTKA